MHRISLAHQSFVDEPPGHDGSTKGQVGGGRLRARGTVGARARGLALRAGARDDGSDAAARRRARGRPTVTTPLPSTPPATIPGARA
ncbi:hypothetical protein GCM10028787_29710 [Brachybacterium horti]